MVKIQSGISIHTHSLIVFKFVKQRLSQFSCLGIEPWEVAWTYKKIFFSLKIKLEISSNHLMILDG